VSGVKLLEPEGGWGAVVEVPRVRTDGVGDCAGG
jgi:hypothetical protein